MRGRLAPPAAAVKVEPSLLPWIPPMSLDAESMPLDPAAAAPVGGAADRRSHSIARLDGEASRHHVRRPVWQFALEGRLAAWRRRIEPETFLQFAGFPRSGHSLIGALVDAHPNALVSHELDAAGLFYKGLPLSRVMALCAAYAAKFERDGKWWNGFSYAVEDAPPKAAIRLVGDKKGEKLVRWCAADPGLLPRMRAEAGSIRLPVVFVLRHPLDNVATLTLAEGDEYDRLRIEQPREAFGAALRTAQAAGDVPATVSDAAIDNYARLCAGATALRAQLPEGDRLDVTLEEAIAEPAAALASLEAFLRLPPSAPWREAAARLVRGGGRSRDKIAWRPEQRARMRDIVRATPFLSHFEMD